jgi:hypothetical protein
MTGPHVPTPREHELPGGDLAVSSHWVWGVRDATTVPAEDRPLYRLLMDILADVHVPDTMPAHLATACEDLVDVTRAVEDIDRGSADIGGRGYGMSFCYRVRDAIEDHRDRDALRLVAVGCSGSKFEEPDLLPARERYKGSYWAGKRRYGEAFGEDPNTDCVRWRIVSAEYALLHPDREIPHYEKTPGDLEGVPVDSEQRLPSGDAVTTLLDQWALDIHEQLAEWLRSEAAGVDSRDVHLEVLLGRDYRDRLEARGVFERLSVPGDVTVTFPFQEEPDAQGGMIEQIDWMGDAVEAAQPVATDGGESDV